MRTPNDPMQAMKREERTANPTIRKICVAILAAAFCTNATAQQTQAPEPPSVTQTAAATPQPTAAAPDAAANTPSPTANLTPQQLEVQKRKTQLAADTAELLKLANELKAEMDKSTKDELSLAVIKKADQVEKLAHKVRDEMKLTMGN